MTEIDHAALFLLFAGALWLAIGFAMSFLGGWRILATYYRSTEPFRGECWHFKSAALQHVGYHNCLTLGADTRGVFISTWFLFRFGHPPLFIPWSEIDSIERCNKSARPMVTLHFRRTPSVAFRISMKLARAATSKAHSRSLPPEASVVLHATTRSGEMRT